VVIIEYWIKYYIVHIKRIRELIVIYIEVLEGEKKYEIKETYQLILELMNQLYEGAEGVG